MTDRDKELDDLLGVLRQRDPEPSAALMTRVLADAAAYQPRPVLAQPAILHPAPGRPAASLRGRVSGAGGLWAAVLAALGGRPGLGGLAAATLAGLWIGFVQPGPVGGLAYFMLPTAGQDAAQFDLVDLLPDEEALIEMLDAALEG